MYVRVCVCASVSVTVRCSQVQHWQECRAVQCAKAGVHVCVPVFVRVSECCRARQPCAALTGS
jgi:hypothetical protein